MFFYMTNCDKGYRKFLKLNFHDEKFLQKLSDITKFSGLKAMH